MIFSWWDDAVMYANSLASETGRRHRVAKVRLKTVDSRLLARVWRVSEVGR